MSSMIAVRLCACILAATFTASACSDAEAASALRTGPEDRVDGFWWTYVGKQSAAVANFGPILETRDGPLRRWSLVIHAPGAEFGLICDQGFVLPEDMAPISVVSSQFDVDLRPTEGTTWGEVEQDTQLVATVNGLY